MANYLDENGVLYLWNKIKAHVKGVGDTKVDKVEGKGLSTNDYTTAEKNKLAGVAAGATANVGTITGVTGGTNLSGSGTSGSVTINHATPTGAATTTSGLYKFSTDSQGHVNGVTAVAKSDITGLGIPSTNTTYNDATQSVHGLMSTADKTKLDGIEEGAEVNQNAIATLRAWTSSTAWEQVSASSKEGVIEFGLGTNIDIHTSRADKSEKGNLIIAHRTPSGATTKSSGFYKVSTDLQGHVNGTTAVTKADITGLGIPAQDTTYSDATQSTHGLMSTTDKAKLDAFGAASTYALKSDIVNMYKYKNSVTDASKLPTSGQTVGDVYNIETASIYGGAGMNVAWNGTAWDPLGEIFSITAVTNAWIDTNCV